jgi:DHA1 family bicyclomycin/chloramphenicol resistance-like MFS transporter
MSIRAAPPLWLLVLVTFSATLAMHMFVPALATVAHDLQASPTSVQLTISLYVLGLAFGQLAYGPLSDLYGRRPLLLGGLALFTMAGVVCLLAKGVETLIVARFVQALGGCSGMLLARAIVRDTSDGPATVQRLALIGLISMVGPGLGPLIGGQLAAWFGWRSILLFLVLVGAAGLLLSWRLLGETLSPRLAREEGSIAGDYLLLLRSRRFLALVIAGGCSSNAMYAFIAASPFIFMQQLKHPVEDVGLVLALMMACVATGNFSAPRLVRRLGENHVIVGTTLLSLAAAVAMLARTLWAGADTLTIVAGMGLYCFGIGVCHPVVQARAMSGNAKVIGSAAGLYGFAQMSIGALCAALAGLGRDHASTALLVLVGAGVIGQAAFHVALKPATP